MYRIYKTVRGRLTNPKNPSPDCWIDINSPTQEDIEALAPYFEIPEEVLISVRDTDEVPKLEEVDDFQFILIQTPLNKIESEEGEFNVTPLGILYNRDYVITISEGKNDVIAYLKTKLKNYNRNKIINTAEKHKLILKLILFSSKIYLKYLKVIYQRIFTAQSEIEKAYQDQELINLIDISKSLAYFNRSLRSNHIVVADKLGKRKMFKATEEDEELFDDVIDETRQAIETVKIYDRIAVDTANNMATIISNRLNQTVKTLTSVTIILMLPTLMASIYGMNIQLPFQEHESAFLIVGGFTLFLSFIGVMLFYRKKLF